MSAVPKIHVRWFTAAGNGTVTDMANAGKRGKDCRIITFLGYRASCPRDDEARKSGMLVTEIEAYLAGVDPLTVEFDTVAAEIQRLVTEADLPKGLASIIEDTIKGIDAPRSPLSAGVDGVWFAGANESGISAGDLKDVNEWREITHGQTGPRAYDIAKKVWGKVMECQTLNQATTILRDAGCKLHGYCGMD